MRYIAAYALLVLGGIEKPKPFDVEKVLEAAGARSRTLSKPLMENLSLNSQPVVYRKQLTLPSNSYFSPRPESRSRSIG